MNDRSARMEFNHKLSLFVRFPPYVFIRRDNFSPTYLRNATAYGVSPRLRFDL